MSVVAVIVGLIGLAVMADANAKRSDADDGFDAVGTAMAPSREECSGSGSSRKCSDYVDLRVEGPDGENIAAHHVKVSRRLNEGQQHPVLLVYDAETGFEVVFGGTSEEYRSSADTQYRGAAALAILGGAVLIVAGPIAGVLWYRQH